MLSFIRKSGSSTLVLGVIIFLLAGCATIPGEAPELSAELGNRISTLEEAHFNLLHKFFDEKRNQIDEFIEEEWVPEFAEQFFANPAIERAWAEIVRSGNKQDRLEFIVRLGPKLQSRINSKRMELIKPLEDAERLIEQHLRDEYQQSRAINNSITSFLASAAKVDENRRRYLEMVGVKDQQVANVVDKVDSAVGSLVDKARELPDKQKRVEKYLDKVSEVFGKLKN
jgi:hypothetical protein